MRYFFVRNLYKYLYPNLYIDEKLDITYISQKRGTFSFSCFCCLGVFIHIEKLLFVSFLIGSCQFGNGKEWITLTGIDQFDRTGRIVVTQILSGAF